MSPTNPTVPSGSYSIKGGCDKSTGKIAFAIDEWKEHPDGYSEIDFYGYVDLEKKKIVGNYELNLTKAD